MGLYLLGCKAYGDTQLCNCFLERSLACQSVSQIGMGDSQVWLERC